MKSTLDDDKFKDKVSGSDRKIITDKCDETIKWLDMNQTAEKDEYEDKQKDIEQVCNPIIQNLYSEAGGGAGGAGMPGGGMPGGGMPGGGMPGGGMPGGMPGGAGPSGPSGGQG